MSDLTKRLTEAQTKRQSKSEAAIAANDAAESGPQRSRAAPPPRPQEKVGIGRDLLDETTRVVLKSIDGRISMLAESGANPSLLAELRARRKLVLEEAARAKK